MASEPGCERRVAGRSSGVAVRKGGNAWLSPYPPNRGGRRCDATAACQPAQAAEGLSADSAGGRAQGVCSLRRDRGDTAA
jgi:hypothetical protein